MADYYFNFPPQDQLTISQQSAVNATNPIALSGGPGTGKSFVSLWRHIINHKKETPVKSQLLTFTTSLAYYLKTISSKAISSNPNDEHEVSIYEKYCDSTQNWYYKHAIKRAEIIVDEAQDMPLDFYKNRLNKYASRISYGADDKQILKSRAKNEDGTFNLDVCSPEKELQKLFRNRVYTLDENFRNTKRILEFANRVFKNAFVPKEEINSCRELGEIPSLLITQGDTQKQNDTIKDIIRQFHTDDHNIGILAPLANVPWRDGEILTAKYYYNLLKDEFDCSFYDFGEHDGHGLTKMKNIHITPFKSAKGLEFDTVIIPCFDYYSFNFRVISWRDFFVGVTRAKSNLYLFSEKDIAQINSVVDPQVISDEAVRSTYEEDLPF
uniref:3'-5' exonuclease n=1 Tax=uncultured Draconibacterium sp. TaxID=1573823 RepID=UPI003217383D